MERIKNIQVYKVAISYYLVHFLVELVCFGILTQLMSFTYAFILAAVFDFFAFVPQILFGVINVKWKKLDIGTIGTLLMALGVVLYTNQNIPMLIISISMLAIGNCILHECGAISTVVNGNGKLFPSALFVAGGSFGLVIGKLCSTYVVNKWYFLIPLACIEILVLFTNRNWLKEDVKYPTYDLVNKKIDPTLIVVIATFITFVRSFIGYAIPISWNKTIWQTLLLFFLMGIGKAFGGFVSDKIGVYKTGLVTTIFCIPFLIFGENIMFISILGVFMFSMTMSITYGMILSIIKDNPGVAFGFTTIGLFLGLMPVFICGNFSVLVNDVLIVILSLLSAIMFNKTLKKESKNESIK